MKIVIVKKVDIKSIPVRYIINVADGQITLEVPEREVPQLMKAINGKKRRRN